MKRLSKDGPDDDTETPVQGAQRPADRITYLERANKELEAFAYSISHDLIVPLRGIVVLANTLRRHYGDQMPVEARQLVETIHKDTERTIQLTRDLLGLSKAGRKPMMKTVIDMSALAQSAINDLAAAQVAGFRKPTIQALPGALGDATLLKLVFVNLLSNAFKFTQRRSDAEIEVGSVKKSGRTVYFVRDNGVGFENRHASRLFKAFARLHSSDDFEGNGIGLALVERIISRHEGRVWAESRLGHGATFFFSLPTLPETPLI
jgi:light-regulated signal transduction histidine kinase (bacteriophytochrome)